MSCIGSVSFQIINASNQRKAASSDEAKTCVVICRADLFFPFQKTSAQNTDSSISDEYNPMDSASDESILVSLSIEIPIIVATRSNTNNETQGIAGLANTCLFLSSDFFQRYSQVN